MGLTQGLLYPSIHGVLGHWAPTAERSRIGTFVYAGEFTFKLNLLRKLNKLIGLINSVFHLKQSPKHYQKRP